MCVPQRRNYPNIQLSEIPSVDSTGYVFICIYRVEAYSDLQSRLGLSLTVTLHVECVERGNEYGMLFTSSLFCQYIHLEYVHIYGMYRANQAEYGIHIRVVAPQEYV